MLEPARRAADTVDSHETAAEIGAHFEKGGERPAWFDAGWRLVRGGFAFAWLAVGWRESKSEGAITTIAEDKWLSADHGTDDFFARSDG